MSFFDLIFFILFLGDFVWCWKMHQRLRRLPWRWVTETGLVVFVGLQVAGVAMIYLGRKNGINLELLSGRLWMASIYIWHCLIIFPLTLLWIVTQVVRGIALLSRTGARLLHKAPLAAPSAKAEPLPPTPSPEMSRREFVSAAVCAAPVVAAFGATGFAVEQWNEFRIREITVPLRHLPPALDGLTIAQVSDLHVGAFTRGPVLDRVVEATNQLGADLVLMPGDLINFSLDDLPAGIDVVKRLQCRNGVFLCEGNHDLYDNRSEFRERTLAAGLRLLVNDSASVTIRGTEVQLLGVCWGFGDGDPHSIRNRADDAISSSMKKVLPQVRPGAFPILLAHHPHAFDFAGDIPLVLSGHTHGGQMNLTENLGFGPMMFRYWSGLYQKDGRAVVVSNGVGNWFPLRINAPAEIIHLTLRAAS